MADSQRIALVSVVGALVAVGVGLGIWFGVYGGGGRGSVPASQSLESVLRQTSRYVGRRVTVHGVVNGTLTPKAATMGGSAQRQASSLLVVSYHGKLKVHRDESVNVTGTVQRFSLQRYTQNAGEPSAVNGGLLQTFAGRPVIVAAKVVRVPPG